MSEFKEIKKDYCLKEYWEGRQNKMIRWWVYLMRGLTMCNEFKYVLAAIISGYVILKLTQPILMIIVGIASLPLLIILGRWQLRKASKVEQWIGVEHGSVLRWNSYNLQVKTLEMLEEISIKLDKLGGK